MPLGRMGRWAPFCVWEPSNLRKVILWKILRKRIEQILSEVRGKASAQEVTTPLSRTFSDELFIPSPGNWWKAGTGFSPHVKSQPLVYYADKVRAGSGQLSLFTQSPNSRLKKKRKSLIKTMLIFLWKTNFQGEINSPRESLPSRGENAWWTA